MHTPTPEQAVAIEEDINTLYDKVANLFVEVEHSDHSWTIQGAILTSVITVLVETVRMRYRDQDRHQFEETFSKMRHEIRPQIEALYLQRHGDSYDS